MLEDAQWWMHSHHDACTLIMEEHETMALLEWSWLA